MKDSMTWAQNGQLYIQKTDVDKPHLNLDKQISLFKHIKLRVLKSMEVIPVLKVITISSGEPTHYYIHHTENCAPCVPVIFPYKMTSLLNYRVSHTSFYLFLDLINYFYGDIV